MNQPEAIGEIQLQDDDRYRTLQEGLGIFGGQGECGGEIMC